ncbi:hypothetical protein [Saccharothrix variisporea]|nr:hypothetical protein [Saccharothrix variisporea]
MNTRNSEDSHLGTALTGAAVLFVLLRVLAVSHYDWHTTLDHWVPQSP